jgi:APA family basic amino acid/polyamine antiporter
MEQQRETTERRPAELGLWDAVSVIVGIVVGVSIFKAPPTVFGNVGTPWAGVAVWGLGGLVALAGALCYAELATAYPGSGGDYIYLTRAFGPLVGFLFAWTRLAVILTGNIAALAYVFGDYAVALFAGDPNSAVWFACAAVVGLTLFNIVGLKTGKWLQNFLSALKVLGLAGLLVAGLMKGSASTWSVSQPVSGPGFGLAMILVLYAYGGWNDAVFVAADVREPKRNMPRALALGTLLIAGLYILVNAAFVSALGFAGIRGSRTPAADVLGLWLGNRGVTGMSLMVMVSALGAVSGLILAGCRLHASVGADYRIFAWLGRWNARLNAPIYSLVTQALVSVFLILAVGTEAGRNAVDRSVTMVGLPALPWTEYQGGFDTLVAGTSPLFWFFFLLTGISLLVLRFKDREPRAFPVPFFPVVPLVFIGASGYMLYASIAYAKALSLMGIVPLVIGVPLYLVRGEREEAGRKPHGAG